ncbi:hypothetical protein CHS0354_023129 [Potamilus streckersoni]|uniref:TIR domain-containing protein n=1 Tax=Potamilus streckersoni TaxID=2493646 RepID=A0AAE0RN59_9BIVA|nr:hypothetical protein CHS0354_023129 [Potamilus streckersoni]
MFRTLSNIVLLMVLLPICKLEGQGCPSGCKCNVEQYDGKISVSCDIIAPSSSLHNVTFPNILPNNTQEFFFRVAKVAHEFNETVISFADITWAQVEEITLQGVCDLELNQTRLYGLSRLKVLRLKDGTLTNRLHPDAFLQTPNVEVFDLSYNPDLSLKSVVAALTNSLPNLKYLDLCNLEFALDETFISRKAFAMAIENKPLITLNVSNSRINYIVDWLTFKSIRYLNVSNTYSLLLAYSPNINLLPSLEEIDISRTSIPEIPPGLERFDHTWSCFLFLLSVKRIIANNLRITGPMYLRNYHLEIKCNSTSLEALYLRYSNIRMFNVTIDKTFSNLKLLDFEGNSMEVLSPTLLQKAPNLQEIYLARNKLSTMVNLGDLFQGNIVLKVVDLSHNDIEFIPWTMFTNNPKLETLRLQGNLLSVFHFSVEKLLDLKLLDLRDNMIKYVSRDAINGLFSIVDQQGRVKMNTDDVNIFTGNETEYASKKNRTILLSESITDQLVIDLTGNVMECTCDRIWLIEWILYTHIFLIGKHFYTCKFDNNLNYMSYELLNDIMYNCNLKKFLGVTIAVPSSVFLIIVFAYVMVRRQRIRKRKALRYKTLVDRYNLNKCEDRQRHFVFLSFAGKDCEIVNTYIVSELEKFVREIFGDNDNLICTGDSHFTPGRWITEEIDRCLNKCDVIVMVVTKHFIRSEWCKYEAMMAKQKNKFKILLVNEDVYKKRIPSALKGILNVCTRATWRLQNNQLLIRPEWRKIFEGMLEASAKISDEEKEVI